MIRSTRRWRALACFGTTTALLIGPAVAVGATARPVTHANVVAPHATGVVAHTYTVDTTTDATLSGTAPAGSCHDTGYYSQCSLRAAFSAANNDFDSSPYSWDVIKVPAGTFNLTSTVGYSLFFDYTGDLTVEGAGAGKSIVNGADLSSDSIFDLEAYDSNVSFSGLTFEHGTDFYGGAIDMDSYGSLDVQGCAFLDNYASDDGGAIYAPSYTTVTVTDSTFTDNGADLSGGAIYQSVSDESAQALTLTGDSFSHNYTEDNTTGVGGGAVNTKVPVQIANSTFTSNTSNGEGGAIYSSADVDISNSTFESNSAYYDGGAILTGDNAQIDASTFTSNASTDYSGGAVYSQYDATYTSDTFSHNRAASDGGDIYADYEATILNSTLSHGAATVGGSLYDEFSLTVINSTISDSSAVGGYEGGGIALDEEAFLSLDNTSITGATAASGYGGAIYETYDDDVSILGGSFTNDSAVDGYGGAFYAEDDDTSSYYDYAFLSLSGATVSNDTAEYGGGMALGEYSDALVTNSTFEHDSSTFGSGGGIVLFEDATATVNGSTFASDTALGDDGYGGAIGTEFLDGPNTVNLTSDTFTANKATYGGAIYGYNSYYVVNASTFVGNLVTEADPSGYGGAMYNNGSAMYATDSIFSGNDGSQCGGSGFTTSFGHNLDSDNSCGFHGSGDIVSHAALMGPLGNNGGSTPTMLPLSGSLAIGTGGASCPTTDQRGVSVPTGATCDIGAVFVEGTTTTLTASKGTITKGAESVEVFTVTVKGKTGPVGSVEVLDGKTVVCHATLLGPKGTTATATCSPGASTIKTGTASLTASYAGSGINAPGVSKVVKVKVT